MVPPTLMGFSKRVPPNGDTICGKFVPGGTDIMTNMYSMLRNRDVFGEDADAYRPERFLEVDEKNKSQQIKVIDLAFGHGRWGCPGKALAWMELNKAFVEVSCPVPFVSLTYGASLIDYCAPGYLASKKIRFPDPQPGNPVAMHSLPGV